DNQGYGFQDLSSVPQNWLANHWYKLEIGWQTDGTITVRLLDSDGATLLNTVTAKDTAIAAGGIAFRSTGPTFFVDTVRRVVGAGNDDWYAVNVIDSANSLRLETSTPADGAGQFANGLNPHLELYS